VPSALCFYTGHEGVEFPQAVEQGSDQAKRSRDGRGNSGVALPQQQIRARESPAHGQAGRAEGDRKADADGVTASPAENTTGVAFHFVALVRLGLSSGSLLAPLVGCRQCGQWAAHTESAQRRGGVLTVGGELVTDRDACSNMPGLATLAKSWRCSGRRRIAGRSGFDSHRRHAAITTMPIARNSGPPGCKWVGLACGPVSRSVVLERLSC